MNIIAVSRTILLQITIYSSQDDPKLVSDSQLRSICLSDRFILHLLGLVLFQIVTKDLHGDIRSRIEHVNAYFEHHAMFEVEIHLSHPFSYFTGIFILFSLSTGTLSPAWYCACVYQGRSYRGDLEILEMFVDITVNTTALQIREGYGQLNGFGDWPHYP